MDNIKKKSFMQKITNICKYVSIIVPVVADIFGIIAFFAKGIQNWINNAVGIIPYIIVIVVVNILLIANIFVFVEKTTGVKANKAKKFIDGYKKILKNYTNSLVDYEEKCRSVASIDELYNNTSSCLKALVDDTGDVLSKITGKKVRACVKAFPEKYTHHDIFKMELMTICRSDRLLSESIVERQDRIPVHENTDFKLIMVETYPYFAFNNLLNFEKETKTEYENTTKHWEKKYLATIVFPISKCFSTHNGKESFEVLGFLCVDALSTQAFSGDIGPMCIDFVESLSYLAYEILDKCIQYRETLEQAQCTATEAVPVQ